MHSSRCVFQGEEDDGEDDDDDDSDDDEDMEDDENEAEDGDEDSQEEEKHGIDDDGDDDEYETVSNAISKLGFIGIWAKVTLLLINDIDFRVVCLHWLVTKIKTIFASFEK